MINSLLYCTDNSSSLVFNGFCGKDAIGEVKNIVNRSDGFCIDDLSFNVKIDGSIYLCSPSFSRDKKKGSLRANCIILNKLFRILCILIHLLFVHTEYPDGFG